MKICFISSIFPPYSRGGAEVVVEATARAFAEGGHEVFVITCAPFEGWRSFAGAWEPVTNKSLALSDSTKLSFDGVRIFRFTPFNLFTIFNLSKYPPLLRLFWHVLDMFNLHTYLVVRRILREEKPDLIITRNLKGLGYTVPLAIRYSLLAISQGKWLHGLHDLNALHPRGFMEYGKESAIHNPNPLVRLYRAVARWLFGSPDVVIAPSQFVLGEYERAGFFVKSKKVVVKNPILDVAQTFRSDVKAKALSYNSSVPRFLFLGQLEPYKGLRVLIEAWRQFVAKHPQATLEIVGQGSLEEELKRAAQMIPGIHLRGFISHDELPALFSGATATILPSLAYETFGMSVAESLAHGVPVIASRIGALEEIVKDGVNGILVAPGDPTELAQALEQVTKIKSPFPRFTPFSPAQYQVELEKLYKA